MNTDKKYEMDIVLSRLEEVLGLSEGKEIQSIYWGTAPTGQIHIGYLIPFLKIVDFLNAGKKVIILLADLHAMLDNLECSKELVNHRCEYYEKTILAILKSLNANTENLSFVRGSSYQLSPEYTLDAYRLTTLITEHDAKKAGTEVVKQNKNAKLSSLIYPGLQALDEVYLKVDAELGGIDQRKIFVLADKYLPQLGYSSVVHLMNRMLPAINAKPSKTGETSEKKMSSSDISSKITFTEADESIRKKVNKAFCEDGNIEFNPLLEYLEHVLIPLVKVSPCESIGEEIFSLKKDFQSGKVKSQELKKIVGDILCSFIQKVRTELNTENYKKCLELAYPDEK